MSRFMVFVATPACYDVDQTLLVLAFDNIVSIESGSFAYMIGFYSQFASTPGCLFVGTCLAPTDTGQNVGLEGS